MVGIGGKAEGLSRVSLACVAGGWSSKTSVCCRWWLRPGSPWGRTWSRSSGRSCLPCHVCVCTCMSMVYLCDVYVCVCINVCVRESVCVCVCLFVRARAYVNVYVYICVYTYMSTHTHTHIHAHTHTHTHTHIHTCVCMCVSSYVGIYHTYMCTYLSFDEKHTCVP